MIGIVLWSDATVGKAVIWCEDQGDLAFYTHAGTFDTFETCVGDWVCFNLILDGDLRVARDIKVLQEPRSPGLVHDLVGASDVPNANLGPKLVEACVPGARGGVVSNTGKTSEPAPRLRQEKAARTKVEEGLDPPQSGSKSGSSVPLEGTVRNVISFPVGQSRRRRSA